MICSKAMSIDTLVLAPVLAGPLFAATEMGILFVLFIIVLSTFQGEAAISKGLGVAFFDQ